MAKIDRVCPGDCSKCALPDEIPNFDWHGCVLHQIFQKTIKLEKDYAKLSEKVGQCIGEREKVFVEQHELEEEENETSDKELFEQEGEE